MTNFQSDPKSQYLKIGSLLSANVIFILHIFVVFVLLFGWYFEEIKTLYLITLILTLAFETVLGYCPLTKYEFLIRKKLEPGLDYDYSFISYYGYKFAGIKITPPFIKRYALVFLWISLILNLLSFLLKATS